MVTDEKLWLCGSGGGALIMARVQWQESGPQSA
jgi:hypothetical protein